MKNLILSIFSSVMFIGTTSYAQQMAPNNILSDTFIHTDVGACLKLYEQLNVKREGKATSYRLMGTRTTESNQLIDTQKIWYSHEFGSNPITPVTVGNSLTSSFGYDGTLFDSVVKFVPDPQNPGQIKIQLMLGYSFNSDLLPTIYYYKYLNSISKFVYSYNSAKKLATVDFEHDSSGTWIPSDRELHSYSGNDELIEGFRWNRNTASWDSLFKKYVRYNSNSNIDSSYLENYSNGNWIPFKAQAFDYEGSGQRTRVANYTYNEVNQTLEPHDLSILDYDAGGQILSRIYYYGPDLDLLSRYVYHYSGIRLDSIVGNSWDTAISNWKYANSTIISYSFGLPTKRETFVNYNGTVRPFIKFEFSSDANQNISYSGYFIWNEGSESYTAKVKHYYTYEAYQKTTTSLIKAQKEILLIYPNPAKGPIHLEIPFEGKGTYKIVSMDGMEVYADNFGSDSDRLHVLDLKLKSGVYMLILSDESGQTFSGKVAIE